MTTSTFYSTSADGRIQSQSSDYVTCRAGSNLAATTDSSLNDVVGQKLSGSTYFCWELFLDFDTSSIPDTDVIDSVSLSLWLEDDLSTQDFTVQARLHDWGGTLTTADWVSGANLSTKTLLATLATNGIGSAGAYKAFTSDAAFVSNVSKTGTTYILLNSDRHSGSNWPSGEERVEFGMQESGHAPKLVVDHSAATGGGGSDPFGMMGFFGA